MSERLGGLPIVNTQQIEKAYGGNQFNTELGHPIILAQQSLTNGSEGAVFEVVSHPQLIAKIPFQVTHLDALRLETIIENNPQDLPKNVRGEPLLALPISTIRDSQQRIIGELMPYINPPDKLSSFYNLLNIEDRKEARCHLENLTFRELLLYGRQLTEAIHTINSVYGGVIGDINRRNIITTRPTVETRNGQQYVRPGSITLIDLTTSQFRDKTDKVIPSSGYGQIDYNAPELVFKKRTDYKEVYTNEREMMDPNKKPREPKEDLHILACIMHELVFGRNPALNTNEDDYETRKPKLVPIRQSELPVNLVAIDNSGKDSIPATRLPLSMVGPKLRQAFYRSLVVGYEHPYERSSTLQWIEAIDETLSLLRDCPNGVNNHKVVEGTNVPYGCACCFTEAHGANGKYFA